MTLRLVSASLLLCASLPLLAAQASFTVVAGDGQTTMAGLRFVEPLRLKLTRAGAPAAGVAVSLQASGDGANIRFATGVVNGAAAVQLVTDASGEVVAPPLLSIGGTGSATVTASYVDSDGSTASIATHYGVLPTFSYADFNAQHIWWGGPVQSGWGMSVAQHGGRLFPVVYAYDEVGAPTWWLSDGNWPSVGGNYAASLLRTSGAPYFAYDPSRLAINFTGEALGLSFVNDAFATFRYSAAPGSMASGIQLPIIPFNAVIGQRSAYRGVGDIWWGGPAQNGWGISITEEANGLFMVWFTYDATGKAVWYSMPAGAWTGASQWSGAVYVTRAAGWTSGYDRNTLATAQAGTFAVDFLQDGSASFRYDVDGHQGTIPISRYAF